MSEALIQQTAGRIMDTLPMLMRTIGGEMRKRQQPELSVAQFRALAVVKHHESASLSLVARHLCSSLSSTSKLVDGLAERSFLTRVSDQADRRRVILALTDDGLAVLEAMHREAIAYLAQRLALLSAEDCRQVLEAMDVLSSLFTPTRDVPAAIV